MSALTITPIAPGRSKVASVTEENVQAVCDHILTTDDMVLVEAPLGLEIEEKIKADGFKTGSLMSKGVMYRIICKPGE